MSWILAFIMEVRNMRRKSFTLPAVPCVPSPHSPRHCQRRPSQPQGQRDARGFPSSVSFSRSQPANILGRRSPAHSVPRPTSLRPQSVSTPITLLETVWYACLLHWQPTAHCRRCRLESDARTIQVVVNVVEAFREDIHVLFMLAISLCPSQHHADAQQTLTSGLQPQASRDSCSVR